MKCPKCNTEMESGFDACWKCGWSPDGENTFEEPEIVNDNDLPCLRCGAMLDYAGNFKFHEGPRIGVLGGIFELFVNREGFDVYVCPSCGKAEFYVSKI